MKKFLCLIGVIAILCGCVNQGGSSSRTANYRNYSLQNQTQSMNQFQNGSGQQDGSDSQCHSYEDCIPANPDPNTWYACDRGLCFSRPKSTQNKGGGQNN